VPVSQFRGRAPRKQQQQQQGHAALAPIAVAEQQLFVFTIHWIALGRTKRQFNGLCRTLSTERLSGKA
jgi:hypothetical protein